MSILVTGGLGFVGSHTCRKLVDEGEKVIALYRTPRKIDFFEEVSDRIMELRGDILDLPHLMNMIKAEGITGIVHAAAVATEPPARARPHMAYQINVTGTVNVLEAARLMDLEKVVYISTGSAAGPTEDLKPVSESQRKPSGLYGTTKLMGELMGLSYCSIYSLNIVVVRLAWIYGPGRDPLRTFGMEVPWDLAAIFQNAEEERPVEIEEGGDHPFDFTYVKDAVEVVVSAYRKRYPKYRVYNASVGRAFTLAEAAEGIRKVIPDAEIRIGSGTRRDIYLRGHLDITRAREDLAYVPQYDLERGISEWHNWYNGGKIY